MNKRISAKQALSVLLTVIAIIGGYVAYTLINDKISSTYYYVVFDSDGGSRVTTQKIRYNDLAEKPEDPTKKGYKFKYWSLDNVEYDFSSRIKRNTKLVAIWVEDKQEKKTEEKQEEKQE